jgi:hypothetical protein
MWKVLFVEPCTPGHAPVARLYQPAPVLGGASVRRPEPDAEVPFLRNEAIVGITPSAAYFATRSWRMPSEAKKTAVVAGWPLPAGGAAATGEPTSPARRPMTVSRMRGRIRARVTGSSSTFGARTTWSRSCSAPDRTEPAWTDHDSAASSIR